MRKRVVLGLVALMALAACKKTSEEEVRWLESSQKLETIVFGDGNGRASSRPVDAPVSGDRAFFFQFRQLPQDASYSNPSGMYFSR